MRRLVCVWSGWEERRRLTARQKCSQISEDGRDWPNVATLIILKLNKIS